MLSQGTVRYTIQTKKEIYTSDKNINSHEKMQSNGRFLDVINNRQDLN